MKKYWLDLRYLLILVIIAALPRFFLLNTIPPGINFDELDYLINAKTVFVAGTDLSGTWNPWSLTTIPREDPKGELIPILLAPFIGPFPFSLFIAKLPFTLAGILSVLLIYLIAKSLFNRKIAFIVGVVMALNPLTIFSSRIGYDGPFTATFFLAALAIMLRARGWKLLFSIPFLFLTFHGYVGMKLVLIPFTLATSFYSWKEIHKKKYTKQFLLILLFVIVLVGSYIIRLPYLPASSRSATIFSPSHPMIINEVNNQRRLSLALPSTISNLFINKYTLYGKEITNRFLNAFSPSMLFYAGDAYHFFFLWNHGIFFYTDLIALLIGSYVLWTKYKKVSILSLVLLPIFSLPSLLSGPELSYVYRSYLLYVWLTLVIGVGINQLINQNKKYSKLIITALILVYSVQFVNFAWEFFIRNPVYHQDQSQLTHRVFSRFLKEESQNNRKIMVLGSDTRQMFQQYILFSGLFNQLGDKVIRETIAERFKADDLRWEGITFTPACEKVSFNEQTTLVLRDDIACDELRDTLSNKYMAVARISDSGHEYRIYNAKTCSEIPLKSYIRSVSLNDLQIEQLPLEKYCITFIINNL